MCWVLDADINLGGGTIKAVGRHTTGFQGTLYGNKHVIKNGTVQYETWIGGTTHYAVGLFHFINGGQVYDLTLDSTLKYSMATNINANVYIEAGGLAAVAYNYKVVGVNSKITFDNRQTSSTNAVYCNIGGLLGSTSGGTMVKCTFDGNLYFRGSSVNLNSNNTQRMGGLIGDLGASTTVSQCSVKGNISEEFNGPNIGGLVGKIANTNSIVLKISDIVLNVNVRQVGECTSPDIGLIYGWEGSQALNATNGSCVKNVYVVGGGIYYNSSTPTYYMYSNWDGTNYDTAYSNIYLPIAAGTTVYPNVFNTSSATQKKNDTAGVVSSANSNPAISNNYTLTNAGGITSNNVSSGHIAFIKGAGR